MQKYFWCDSIGEVGLAQSLRLLELSLRGKLQDSERPNLNKKQTNKQKKQMWTTTEQASKIVF